MVFLTLLYLCVFLRPSNTLALPADLRPTENFATNHQSIFNCHEKIKCDTRTIYNILWSCFSTIFACTWIVVHPNIPAPGDSQWTVLRRRAAIMAFVLIAPEFVIYWAARQHYAACYFTTRYEGNHPGWTRAHSFFLIMGGFTLHEAGKPVRVLEAKELERLSEAGEIEWPTITKEEIADRSKGDYLAKTIVLLQTTWFVVQCIARGAYGLAVTELEVVTVAFAGLTGVFYYFWWDKPLDACCSIPVHRLEDRLGKIEEGIENEDTGSQITSLPEVSDQEIWEGDEKVVVIPNPLPSTPIQVDTSTYDPALSSTRSHTITPSEVSDQDILQGDKNVVVNPNPLPPTLIRTNTSTWTTPDPALPRIGRFQAFKRSACEKYGTVFGLGYVFILLPLKRFFKAFVDMVNCKNLGDKTFLRVPTFYSPPNENNDNCKIAIFTLCVATLFGAIHCIAWSFHFPTSHEQWAWRISAILVSGLPSSSVATLVICLLLEEGDETICSRVATYVQGVINYLYVIARITLFILPFMALRALPEGAYRQLDWVSSLPHI